MNRPHDQDGRIPIRLRHGGSMAGVADPDLALLLAHGSVGAGAGAGWAAVLVLPELGAEPHPALCRCCGGREPAATELIALYQGRARGRTGFFAAIEAWLPPEQGLRLARVVAGDAFLSACFRMEPANARASCDAS